MMQEREFRELCKQVGEELKEKYPNLTTEQIVEMVKDSFEFVEQHISAGSLTPVYFQYLGRFRVKEGRKEFLKKRKEKHDSKQSELLIEGATDAASEES